MMKKKIAIFIMIIGLAGLSFNVNESNDQFVIISTSYGDMKLKLYNETPAHRDNFLKLVNENFYDGLLFHRVMKDFMIQAGDPNSRTASANQNLGNGGPGYTIPKEFNPNFIHKKGALSAARKPDNVNPEHASSGSQFYIVQGKVFDTNVVLQMETRRNAQFPENEHWFYSDEQINTYTTIGGTPHLDGNYTVFGELIEGFDVLDAIAAVPVNNRSRPLTDISMEVYLVK
jgi:peptidyl-prolyl cis-trans isomerase B (cyclophilin B)